MFFVMFTSRYPDKELIITGELFGALIRHELVTDVPLGVALRNVLEAIRKTPGSKIFRFGITSLIQFQSRLPEWPQYCAHLVQIPHLKESHPEIIQRVQQVLLSSKLDIAAPDIVPTHGAGINEEPVARLVDQVSYEPPVEGVRDKILFIVNNMSFSNMEPKVKELKTLLKESHCPWFSNYLVMKRVSIEPNFHSLYLALLDALDSKEVNKCVLTETYTNIRALLSSEKTATSSQERTLLKNLGSWLGLVTLAKNKPIKHKDLALKECWRHF
jgi:CCR4-NOT transcription complex subunit 1